MKLPDMPWTEKYRPSTLDEIIGQKQIVSRVKAFVKNKSFPNMIFAGPAGIGKTTCAIAMAREMYGNDMSAAFKELNASDARGIDVIRGEVKEFAKTVSIAKVPIKIIFLDEADALTSDAQHALRRTMEQFSSETRFILSANYASKIIEPIQSRCIVFRFRHLTEDDMRVYIKRVAEGEGLEVDDRAVEALIYVSDGDLRKLTNVLQSVALEKRSISENSVYEIAARARPKEISTMLKCAVEGAFEKGRTELNNLMVKQGLSGEDILTQCYKEAQILPIDERSKLDIMVAIGEANFRIVEGANERIQLEAMLAQIALNSTKRR